MGRISFILLLASSLFAENQSEPGAGNSRAEDIGHHSALVQSARHRILKNLRGIRDPHLREATSDALSNPQTCVAHRAGLSSDTKQSITATLLHEGFLNESDGTTITGGLVAGVFPPLLHDNTDCPQLPLTISAAPGSSFGGHHSYPGGLALHELFNQESASEFAELYHGVFSAPALDKDILLAAPAWHDWAKMMVFQWNADGSEFTELNIAGTGGHHIIGLAETMARGLPPFLVVTQACAHSAPTLGNESKVIGWLRAAAILARIDPVAKGYLLRDADGQWRLPRYEVQPPEYQIHNLSDGDFVESIPAVGVAQTILANLSGDFGYQPAEVTRYNTQYRNVVLSQLSAERIHFLFARDGQDAVAAEIRKLKQRGLL